MRAVKRAFCFWCDTALLWSSWNYIWYSAATRFTHCAPDRPHLASQTQVER